MWRTSAAQFCAPPIYAETTICWTIINAPNKGLVC